MSKFRLHHHTEEFEVWEFTPDVLHAFPFRMEHVTASWRARCFLEYFVGYKVYYIKKNDRWAGYCVISNGRNPRYAFASSEDIIFGRYFIANDFRGNGLGLRMLDEILNRTGLEYGTAYAYLKIANEASRKTLMRLGAEDVKRFRIVGFSRRLQDDENGDYILVSYRGTAK